MMSCVVMADDSTRRACRYVAKLGFVSNRLPEAAFSQHCPAAEP